MVKEATETETGLKSRTCKVCGDEETAVIPIKGQEPEKPDTPDVPSSDSYVHNFTKDGLTNGFFTFTNCKLGKKTSSYNGMEFTQYLKMESKTNVKFTTSSKGKLTLVFAAGDSSVKINGKSTAIGSNGVLSIDVAAGTVEITKDKQVSLFYMVFTPEKSSTPDTPDVPDTPDDSSDTIAGVVKDKNLGYTVNKDSSGTQLLTGVKPALKAGLFKTGFGTNITVKSADGEELAADAAVGTGCVVELIKDNKVVDTVTVVVKGDTDGNGAIDVLDMEAIQKSILGIGDELTGAYKEAATLTEGADAITVLDMEAIQKDILGIANIN